MPGRKFTGVVTRTSNALDPATRTLLTEVQVANPDGRLMPGMYAQVDLAVPRKDPPLLIPGDTLVVRSDGPQVAVVQPDGTVHFTRIQLGRDFGDRLEVLCGLEEGQQLVVNPSDAVREGVKVKARRRSGKAPPARSSRTRKCSTTLPVRPSRCFCRPVWVLSDRDTPAYRAAPAVRYENSPRVHDLIRAGQSLPVAAGCAGAGHREQSGYRTAALPAARRRYRTAAHQGRRRDARPELHAARSAGRHGGPLSPVLTNAAAAGRATAGQFGEPPTRWG